MSHRMRRGSFTGQLTFPWHGWKLSSSGNTCSRLIKKRGKRTTEVRRHWNVAKNFISVPRVLPRFRRANIGTGFGRPAPTFRFSSTVFEFCIETQLHRRAKRLCSSCITRGHRLFLGNCWKFNEAACPRTIFSQPRCCWTQLCTRILKPLVRSSVISVPRHEKHAKSGIVCSSIVAPREGTFIVLPTKKWKKNWQVHRATKLTCPLTIIGATPVLPGTSSQHQD